MIAALRLVAWLMVAVQTTNVVWYQSTSHPYLALTAFNVAALVYITRIAVQIEIDHDDC